MTLGSRAPRRREGMRRYGFVIMLVFSLAAVFVPLASTAEVEWAGGPTRYWTHTGIVAGGLGGGPTTSYQGMIGCANGKPDYLPALPLEVGGGLFVAIGLVGAITRTVQIRRGTALD